MHHKEMVVVGGGHSGVAMAMGAAKLGIKVLLVEKQDLLSQSCSLAKSIRKDSFLRFARSVAITSSITNCTLQAKEINNLFDRINQSWRKYPRAQIMSLLNDLGIEVWLGEARVVSKNVITVGGRVVSSNRLVLATGIEEQIPNILGIEQVKYRTISNFFDTPITGNSVCIVGGTIESFEFAQGLAQIGLNVTLAILPNQVKWEIEALNKVGSYISQDGVEIHLISKIKEVYRQNKRSIIVCSDELEDNFTLDGHDLVFANSPIPQSSMNIMSMGLMITTDGVWVNNSSQTSKRGIYAVGSVTSARNPYMNKEEQISIALHNLLLKKPQRVVESHYRTHMINTSPGYVEVGEGKGKGVKEATVKLSNYNKPFLQNRGVLEVTLRLKRNSIVGFSAFGDDVAEVSSNLMHAVDPDANIWSFARLPHLPGTMSHSLKRIIESLQPNSFFPRYIGVFARFADKIIGITDKSADLVNQKLSAYTRRKQK